MGISGCKDCNRNINDCRRLKYVPALSAPGGVPPRSPSCSTLTMDCYPTTDLLPRIKFLSMQGPKSGCAWAESTPVSGVSLGTVSGAATSSYFTHSDTT